MTLLRFILLLTFAASFATAQIGTATLRGTVSDSTGGVLPLAEVAVQNDATGLRITTRTAPDGSFSFTALQPATYSLSAEAKGFSRYLLKDLSLSASEEFDKVIILEPEPTTFTIETTASAAGVRIQTNDSQISRVLTLKELEILPQINRDPMQLAALSPGAMQGLSGVRVNGARNGGTNVQQDGIGVVDFAYPRFDLTTQSPNLDSIAEVRIITAGGRAEFGRNGGAQVELISRAGTNRFSGNLFHYLRNTALNANSFFSNQAGVAREKFIQNLFGGSLGGPIRKNRTFFFANVQAPIVAQEVRRNRTVPTDELRGGLFRWRTPAGVEQSFDILRNDPRGLGLTADMRRKFGLIPSPNNRLIGDGLNTAGFLFNSPANSNNPQGMARIDHQLSGNQRLFLRYSQGAFSSIDAFNGVDAPFPGVDPGRQNVTTRGLSIGWDANITPTLTNQLRTGFSTYDVTFAIPRAQGPVIVPSSFTNPDFSGASSGRKLPNIDINDNLSWTRGKHSFKFGATWRRSLGDFWSEGGAWPNIFTSRSFNNIPPASIGPNGANVISALDRNRFEGFYNDLLGRVSSISQSFQSNLETYFPAGTPMRRNYIWQDWSFFAQNDWRIHPRLTLNLGLRYELFEAPKESSGILGNLDRPDAALGFTPVLDFRVQRNPNAFRGDHNNFAPRFGLAYDPFGDGKTSIRASFGLFYDRGIGATLDAHNNNTPGFVFNAQSLPNQSGTSDIRITDSLPMPTPPATFSDTPTLNRSVTASVPTSYMPTPYFMQWNFTLQREILKGSVLEVGYVANRGIKLLQALNVNQKNLRANGFINDFVELQAFQSQGAAVSPTNTLVRLFGTPQAAIASLGASNFQLNAAGAAAENLDRNFFSIYSRANLPQSYMRLFPQFNQLIAFEASGRSYFDSLQISLRRDTGWLRTSVNYMFSKNLETIAGEVGAGSDVPADRLNLRNTRGYAGYHIPHHLSASSTVRLPFGWGRRHGASIPRWLNFVAGGWDLGAIALFRSGSNFTVLAPVDTFGATTYANFAGSSPIGHIERTGNGVRFFTTEQRALFSTPAAGQQGSLVKGFFRGMPIWGIDTSLIKRFSITERQSVSFRAEAYNLTNTPIFGGPNTAILNPDTFGRVATTVSSPRNLQLALRYEF